MKKIFINHYSLLIIAALLLFGTAFAKDQPIAYVDMSYILKNLPQYESASEQLSLISKRWQKEIDAAKITSTAQKMANDLGKYKGAQFVAWTRFDQADQMMYLLSFEKEPVVRCVFLFDKKGNLQNFALSPVKQTEVKKDEKKK